MAICGGVAGGVFALNATQNKKFENPNTVAATATVIPVHVRGTEDKYVLRYVYEDEDGNKYVFDPEFGTLNTLRENKTMTVYYNRYNPEHAFAKPKVTFLSVLATFFAAAGVLMFFANIFSTSSIVMPIIAGSVFLTFGGGFLAAIAGAAGLTFLEVIMSGPIQYGCTLFASLGAIFVCAGIYSLFREIYYFFKYLKKKHGN